MPYFRQVDELEGIPVINLHMWFPHGAPEADSEGEGWSTRPQVGGALVLCRGGGGAAGRRDWLIVFGPSYLSDGVVHQFRNVSGQIVLARD